MSYLLIPQAAEIPEILFEHPPNVEQPKQGLQLLGAGPLEPIVNLHVRADAYLDYQVVWHEQREAVHLSLLLPLFQPFGYESYLQVFYLP